jgi:hypothetical protein
MRTSSIDYGFKDEDEVTLFNAQALVAATTYSSPVIDTDCGVARLTLVVDAPAAGTCDVTLETSHDNSTWTTSVLAFTQVTTTDQTGERKRVAGLDRYVRAKAVQAALAPAAWTQAAGSPPAVGSTGTCAVAGTYEVKITTGGARGTAEFSYRVNGGAWSTPALTAATAALGSTGLTATFASGAYVLNDVYSTTATGYTVTLSGELV